MNIIVFMEGGGIQEVLSDNSEANVIIVDRDTEDCPSDEIIQVLGDDAFVYRGISSTSVDPITVQQVIKETEHYLNKK